MYNKNAWEKYDEKELKLLMDFNEDYKAFISKGKTERECVNESITLAEACGYKDINKVNFLKPGDKVYATNMGKNIALFIIGKKSLTDGLRILGAHIDSPRIDLKQNPVYEKDGLA